MYSALGWYDFTNPADPLPELTAELVTENLDQLEALADQGVRFDIYMFDDWWERSDLGSFRRATFPDGPGALVERLESMGMRAGLWWATTRAVWSAAETPGIEPSWANDPTHSALADEVGSGRYDLVVLGAENRAIQHRMFFGYENERLMQAENRAVTIVVPNIAQLR